MPPVTLDWRAPAGCPDSAYVERETTRLLAGADAGAAAVVAHAEVTAPRPRTFRVRLRTEHGSAPAGERLLEASSCRELADAVAFILAASVDGDARADALHTPDDGLPPRPLPFDVHEFPPDDVPSARARSGPPPVHLAVAAALWSDRGMLPTVSFAPAASLEYRPWGHVFAEVGAGYFPHGRATFVRADGSLADCSFSLFAGDLRVGYLPVRGGLEVAPVAGIELASLSGTGGAGVSIPRSGEAAVVSFLAGLRARVALASQLGARIEVDGEVPFERPNFVLDSGIPLHQPSAVGVRLAFGVDVHF